MYLWLKLNDLKLRIEWKSCVFMFIDEIKNEILYIYEESLKNGMGLIKY